ncbi:MAG: adenylyltransferase/cytidyltransferase family protein [bacterium]|nr:adenylyltransferase/cytidyltransferase family protein [bacterium]
MKSIEVPIITPEDRYIETEEELTRAIEAVRTAGLRSVLTMGTFDMAHIGHGRYQMKARQAGDVLFLGLDDDEKSRRRKGDNRPVVPQDERREMAAHMRYADFIVIKRHDEPKWHLIKQIKPDVLIAVEGTYKPQEIVDLEKICGKVEVLPRQAETSTSAKVRRLVMGGVDQLLAHLRPKLETAVTEAYAEVAKEAS